MPSTRRRVLPRRCRWLARHGQTWVSASHRWHGYEYSYHIQRFESLHPHCYWYFLLVDNDVVNACCWRRHSSRPWQAWYPLLGVRPTPWSCRSPSTENRSKIHRRNTNPTIQQHTASAQSKDTFISRKFQFFGRFSVFCITQKNTLSCQKIFIHLPFFHNVLGNLE